MAKSTFQSHAINTRDYEEEYERLGSTQPEERREHAETMFPRREAMKERRYLTTALLDNKSMRAKSTYIHIFIYNSISGGIFCTPNIPLAVKRIQCV